MTSTFKLDLDQYPYGSSGAPKNTSSPCGIRIDSAPYDKDLEAYVIGLPSVMKVSNPNATKSRDNLEEDFVKGTIQNQQLYIIGLQNKFALLGLDLKSSMFENGLCALRITLFSGLGCMHKVNSSCNKNILQQDGSITDDTLNFNAKEHLFFKSPVSVNCILQQQFLLILLNAYCVL
uniref:Uncharacterized protein n=1 Tax=Glossina pallidipes TaxID=7398 RepID=A0A1A9ZUD1_GLOPL